MKLIVAAALILIGSSANAQSAPPASDSRGIPVVSGATKPPPGANQPVSVPDGATISVNPDQTTVFASRAATAVPPCTRTVTDRCTQPDEVRRKPSARRRPPSSQR